MAHNKGGLVDTEISAPKSKETSSGICTKIWLKRDKKGLFLKDKETWITRIHTPGDHS